MTWGRYGIECSATLWVEGDGGACKIKCNLKPVHGGPHEHSGMNENNDDYTILWTRRT